MWVLWLKAWEGVNVCFLVGIEAGFPFQFLRTSYERWDIDRSDLTTDEYVQKRWQLNTDPSWSGTLGVAYRLTDE
jgi:hypothetical protein